MSEDKSTGRESFYAHNLTYPELLAAKDAVINIQGEIIGGPARKYMSEWDRWVQWQKAVVAGSRVLGTIPQPVMDYFQATKGLKKPPVSAGRDIEDAEIVDMRHIPASIILTPPFKPFKPPRFTWSYTSMQEFLTCPAQWAAKRFYKTIKDVESEAMRVGNMVHETAENYGKSLIGVSYKPNLIHAQYLPVVQKYVDVLVKSGAELQFEKEMCFDRQMKLSHWKAWDTVWVRSKADVLAKKGQRLSIIDWKTGKYKEDFLQLKMFAVFAALTPGFEDVQEFDPKFIFTKESPPKNILRLEKPIMRSELKGILKEILGVVARMEAAWKEENFPCKKNGLCKNWCLNTECPHCGG